MNYKLAPLLLSGLLLFACEKETNNEVNNQPHTNTEEPKLSIQLAFSDTLPRLGNLGQPVDVPQENAAQHPNVTLATPP